MMGQQPGGGLYGQGQGQGVQPGGLEPVYVLAGAVAAVFTVSWLVWSAAVATALVCGHGWQGRTAGAAAAFTGHLIVSGSPGTAWHQAAPAAGPLGPGWVFWPLLSAALAAATWGAGVALARYRNRQRAHAGAQWARRGQEQQITVDTAPGTRPWRLTAGHSERTGRLLAGADCMSACVFGPNGSGKTVSFVVPNVLEWDGPAVVTTIKGPDLDYLLNRRRQISDHVYVIAPAGLAGTDVSRWSPVDYAADPVAATDMARWLCEAASLGDDPRARPWVIQARQYIAPLLLAAHCASKTRKRPGIDLFTDWVSRGRDAAEEVQAALRESGHQSMIGQYARVWQLHPDGVGSVMFTATTLTDAYANPQVRASAAASDFTVTDILNNKGTLCIVSPPSQTAAFAPMFTALTATLIDAATKKYDQINATRTPGTPPKPIEPRLGLFLDECGNTFRYGELAQLATTGRGMGIQLATIWHDLSQMEYRYGPEQARTILSQSRMRLLLPGVADPATLTYFSDLLGDTVVDRASHTHGSQGQFSTQTSPQKDPLVAPFELLQLPIGRAVMQYGNLPPMRVRLRNAETDRALLRLARQKRSTT